MATTKVVFEAEAKGTEKVVNSYASIKKELAAAKAAALNGDGVAAKRVAELTDKMEDLRDATKTLQGSGVERVSNSFNLLTEGLQNFDGEKVATAFKGIGSALKAIPLFLVAEGVRLLIENFDEIYEAAKKFFHIETEGEKQIKALNRELEKQKELTASLSKEIERELSIMEAQGVSSDKILAKKKELIQQQIQEAFLTAKLNIAKAREVESNDSITESLIRKNVEVLRGMGLDEKADELERKLAAIKYERNKENLKAVKDSIELIKDLQTKQTVEEIKNEKHKTEEFKKEQEKRLEEYNKAIDKRLKATEYEIEYEKTLRENAEAELKKRKAQFDKEESDLEIINTYDTVQAMTHIKQREREKDREEFFKDLEEKYSLTQTYSQALQGLSDTVFSIRLANAKKGSAEEEKLARQQFKINKALQIANATIGGAQAIITTLAKYGPPPNPVSIAAIIATVATTAASIAKIASTQFNPTQTGAGAESTLPTVNSANNIQTEPPVISRQNQATTELDENGNVIGRSQPIKAYVVESEMTEKQKRVRRLEEQSTF